MFFEPNPTMKLVSVVTLGSGLGAHVSPMEKTIQMLSDLEQKVIREGDALQKEYDEFAEWCEDRARNLNFEIKTSKSQVDELTATIQKEASSADALQTQIEDLGNAVSANEDDLKQATAIREKEAEDFAAEEQELKETVDMLERAISTIEREMSKGAAMMQMKSANNLEQALEIMVKASALSSADATRLSSLVQTSTDDSDSDEEMAAPEAAGYESHSGGLLDTLNGLLDKAQGQLTAAQSTEMNNKNNFEMLKQSLTDEIKYATKDKAAATKALFASQEAKSSAEGDLTITQKDLGEDQKQLKETHMDCMTKSEGFEQETKNRGEELKALAQAKKAVTEMASGAGESTYSFVQESASNAGASSISSQLDLANFEAVRLVRDLARKTNSQALAQLASRMASVLHLGTSDGSDPFAKIRGMIKDMIEKLEKESAEAADLKAWCDKEQAESMAKQEETTRDKDRLETKIESQTTQSEKIKEEIAMLQKGLAELSRTQSEMDKMRAEEKALFQQQKPELEMGLKGVKLALKILNDYFAKSESASEGAGSGIIGMLEVIESDFSKSLAEITAEEEMASTTYKRETQENEVEKAMKENSVKHLTKQAAGLDKSVSDMSTDLEGVTSELTAVNQYLASLERRCTYKVESYAERKANREAEVNGLRAALDILNNEAAFIQKASHGFKGLRGIRKH